MKAYPPISSDLECDAYLRVLDQTEDLSPLEREERAVCAVLMVLQREYQEKCGPWMRRLAEVEALKPPRPIVVSVNDVERGYSHPAQLKTEGKEASEAIQRHVEWLGRG